MQNERVNKWLEGHPDLSKAVRDVIAHAVREARRRSRAVGLPPKPPPHPLDGCKLPTLGKYPSIADVIWLNKMGIRW